MHSRRLTPIPSRTEADIFRCRNDSTPGAPVWEIIHCAAAHEIRALCSLDDRRDCLLLGAKLPWPYATPCPQSAKADAASPGASVGQSSETCFREHDPEKAWPGLDPGRVAG